MRETDWTPALGGLVAGLALAIILWAILRRRRAAEDRLPTTSGGLEDLYAERDQLLAELRDLADSGPVSRAKSEQTRLEYRAAAVLRRIHDLESENTMRAGATHAAHASTEPLNGRNGAPDPNRSAELRGALKGGGIVLILALIVFGLSHSLKPRQDQASVTGNDTAQGLNRQRTSPGEAKHPQGKARPIRPNDTPRLRAAQASYTRAPESIDALTELGYAFADAGGWIDVFKISRKLLERDQSNPDGLVMAAMVRAVMRQYDAADRLIERALANHPANLRVLEVGGRIALDAGNLKRSLALFERGRTHSAGDTLFTELIARAQNTKLPIAPNVPNPRNQAGASDRLGDPAGRATNPALSGTIDLAPNIGRTGQTRPQPGDILFIIVRASGTTSGPPIAAKRIVASKFPATFTISASDSMRGSPFPALLSVSARLDSDGNAMSHSPDDLNTTPLHGISLGTKGVKLVLTEGGLTKRGR